MDAFDEIVIRVARRVGVGGWRFRSSWRRRIARIGKSLPPTAPGVRVKPAGSSRRADDITSTCGELEQSTRRHRHGTASAVPEVSPAVALCEHRSRHVTGITILS